ncbi:hypothetical protein RF11_12436 [Thelohanellus kitauei]|uniref:Uncharacterized protein n=1 Tax=Thelohanellus kitauei TaxID=669202 RepID=A0A0C2NCR5_THEKT|nr:hypothetical protein RF11_12436 [Thelohanellus kitauei]
MPLWYRSSSGQKNEGRCLAVVSRALPYSVCRTTPFQNVTLSHVNNVAITVDVKFVQPLSKKLNHPLAVEYRHAFMDDNPGHGIIHHATIENDISSSYSDMFVCATIPKRCLFRFSSITVAEILPLPFFAV